MILPPNGYRLALLVLALAGFAAAGIAAMVGAVAGNNNDLEASAAAYGYAGPFAVGGVVVFVLWLVVSAILWGIHSEGNGLVEGSGPTD